MGVIGVAMSYKDSLHKPVNPDFAICITAGREGSWPNAEGRARCEALAKVLDTFPNAKAGFVGRYRDGKGNSLAELYKRYFQTTYERHADRIAIVVKDFNPTVQNCKAVHQCIREFSGLKPEHQIEITLCTYPGHYAWVSEAFKAWGFECLSLQPQNHAPGTTPRQDKFLLRVTRRSPNWTSFLGKLCVMYVNRDAQKVLQEYPDS